MSKAAPWSIKGIDYDARAAAKEAARRAGMSVGEWLNSVIADPKIDPQTKKGMLEKMKTDGPMGDMQTMYERMPTSSDRLSPATMARNNAHMTLQSFHKGIDAAIAQIGGPPQQMARS